MPIRHIIPIRVLMAALTALSVAVIVSATETQGVSSSDIDWTAMSPGPAASDEGALHCRDDTHWHGSYKHEKRVTGGGGPGTIYQWHTVRPTEVEWRSTEIICP